MGVDRFRASTTPTRLKNRPNSESMHAQLASTNYQFFERVSESAMSKSLWTPTSNLQDSLVLLF